MFFILFCRRLPEKGSCQSNTSPQPPASPQYPETPPLSPHTHCVCLFPLLPLSHSFTQIKGKQSKAEKLLKNCGKSLHDRETSTSWQIPAHTRTHTHTHTPARIHTHTHTTARIHLVFFFLFLRSLYHNLLFMHFVYSMYICTVLWLFSYTL